MTDTRKILGQLFLVCVVLFIIGFEISTCRGGRGGGGRFSGSRYSSSRYSGSRYGGSRSSSIAWKVALASSLYYGSRRYTTRSRYRSGSEPQICENYEKYQEGANSTQKWGKFVCPLGELPDDYSYCCGEKGRQTCCRFFDDGGRIAGAVIGVLILFGIIGLVIFCICRSQKRKNKPMKTSGSHSSAHYIPCRSNERRDHNQDSKIPMNQAAFGDNRTSGTPGYTTTGGIAYPVAPAYPPGGMAPGYTSGGMAPGYPAYPDNTVMPPSYEKSGGLPYSPNPTGNQVPYPTGPYPMAPDPTAPYHPQHPGDASAPPYSPNPIGFTVAPGQPTPPQGYGYSDPNMPGQGYTAPNAVPPPYHN